MESRPALTIKVDRLAPEGQALGRSPSPTGPGKVVFVPYGVPGDTLEVELRDSKAGYATASLAKVLEPGPGRIAAPCPHHFSPGRRKPWCGGCDWQQLAADAQLEAKRAVVEDCLRRIGRLKGPEVRPVLPSPAAWRYRNKVQVPFGYRDGKVVAGFYAPGSHEIVDFADCPVQPELSAAIVLKVKALAQEGRWPIYEERLHRGWLRHLLVRVTAEGKAQATLVTRTPEFPQAERYVAAMREAFPQLTGLFQNLQEEQTSVILGPQWRRLWGAEELEERVGRLKLRASPGAFLQVNTGACERLYGVVEAQVAEGGFKPALAADLYCGVGAIALWLAPLAKRVLGVEESRDAVADAWENARLNGVTNARFICGRAETLLGRLREELSRLEPGSAAAVVDPPRAGLAPAVIKALGHPALGRVVYVSCNPATFARDAAMLTRSGYRLAEVQPVDLFPQTSHVELSARFDRDRGAAQPRS